MWRVVKVLRRLPGCQQPRTPCWQKLSQHQHFTDSIILNASLRPVCPAMSVARSPRGAANQREDSISASYRTLFCLFHVRPDESVAPSAVMMERRLQGAQYEPEINCFTEMAGRFIYFFFFFFLPSSVTTICRAAFSTH